MTEERKKIALLFGGRSAEHDVSILSARSIRDATPKERFEVIPICIGRDGKFIAPARSLDVLEGRDKAALGDPTFAFERWLRDIGIDIAFPIIHGTFGEDGTLPGYLEIIGIPYTGSGVTGSAVGMDKWHMKYAFANAEIPIVDYVAVSETDWRSDRERIFDIAERYLKLPYFVKPANAGSSVGVSKVKSRDELGAAMEKALRFDDKVLIERGIDAREIEISVLGNEQPAASMPGEIVAAKEFYDYEDKYIDDQSTLVIPAKIPQEKIDELRKLAIEGYKSISAAGFARVDFFMERGTDRIYLNEINTIPGFTRISMYPKLWDASGLSYPKLLERIIELGFERFESRKKRFDNTMKFFDDVKSLT